MVNSFHDYMGLALQEAARAEDHGDVPVGCVVVSSSGTVVGRGRNMKEALRDPLGHAEVMAIRRSAESLGSWRLDGCTVFSTLEPCVMCAGALVHARVARLVLGCDDPKAGAMGSVFRIGMDGKLNHRIEVIRGVRNDECSMLLTSFFRRLRALGKK